MMWRGSFVACVVVVAGLCLAAEAEQASRVEKLVKDLKNTGMRKIAVLAAKGFLKEGEAKQLVEKAKAAGLTLT